MERFESFLLKKWKFEPREKNKNWEEVDNEKGWVLKLKDKKIMLEKFEEGQL